MGVYGGSDSEGKLQFDSIKTGESAFSIAHSKESLGRPPERQNMVDNGEQKR